ncbi:hypothetical protein EDB89DRAFT_1912596 [Lactarius sanguifluus]|nr:hypothetical protein EDB89DRAFT_1912596 [Lactarius sanguifluus]
MSAFARVHLGSGTGKPAGIESTTRTRPRTGYIPAIAGRRVVVIAFCHTLPSLLHARTSPTPQVDLASNCRNASSHRNAGGMPTTQGPRMATGKATTAVQPCRGGVRLDPGDSDHESTQVQDSGHGEDDDIATSNDDDDDDGRRRRRRTTTTTMDDNDRRPRWTTTMEDNDDDGWGCDDGGGQSHSDAAAGLYGNASSNVYSVGHFLRVVTRVSSREKSRECEDTLQAALGRMVHSEVAKPISQHSIILAPPLCRIGGNFVGLDQREVATFKMVDGDPHNVVFNTRSGRVEDGSTSVISDETWEGEVEDTTSITVPTATEYAMQRRLLQSQRT